MNPAGIFKVVSEVCFSCGLFTLQVENEAMCIADRKLLYTVKICTPPILMSLLPPPVLIAGLYNCTDDWAPQTVWQATTTQRTEMSGSLNFTQFLILLWMIKEACPIIIMKSSPNHLCGQTEVVLCALHFHSRETSCFPHWGLALVSPSFNQYFLGWKLVTSGWPSAPHMTSLTPAVSRCWSKALFVYYWRTALASGETMPSNQVWYRCKLGKDYCSNTAVPSHLVTLSIFCVLPRPPLNRRNLNSYLIPWLHASVASSANQCSDACYLKTHKKKKKKEMKSPKWVGWMLPRYGTVTHARLLAIGAPSGEWVGVS